MYYWYYHYVFSGQISVQRCILTVRLYRSRCKEGVNAFVEEAVVRRELADNFCFYNHQHYDSIKGTLRTFLCEAFFFLCVFLDRFFLNSRIEKNSGKLLLKTGKFHSCFLFRHQG